jgi:rhamnosyltransferase
MLYNNSVYALMVSYCGGSNIVNSINSLVDQVNRVVIIDNGSDIASLEILRELKNKDLITLIELGENFGVGYALNCGVNYAKSKSVDWILTLDQDSFLDHNMVSKMLSFRELNSDKAIFSIAPYILFSEEDLPHDYLTIKTPFVITSGHLLSMSIFNEVGYFNDKLFIDGIDFDFCYRLILKNISTYKVSGAFLRHSLGDFKNINFYFLSFNLIVHSPLRRYYLFRNHLYLFFRYFFKLPLQITKKSVFEFILILQILIFEQRKLQNMKMIILGFIDFFRGIYGKFPHKL